MAETAKTDAHLMAAALVAARAGATTGEWSGTLREVFGEFRAPTGVSGAVGVAEAGAELTAVRGQGGATGDGSAAGSGSWSASLVSTATPTAPRVAVRAPGRRVRGGLRGEPLTPEQIVAAAVAEDVHCVGIRSCRLPHEPLPAILDGLREAGLEDVPVVVGEIIPDSTAASWPSRRRGGLHAEGLRLTEIMSEIVDGDRRANGCSTADRAPQAVTPFTAVPGGCNTPGTAESRGVTMPSQPASRAGMALTTRVLVRPARAAAETNPTC